MRKLIAGFKTSVDAKIEGPQGFADWVDTWTDDYGLTPQIDACLLGARMYPGYEQYWTAMQNSPDEPLPMTGKLPTPAELEWAHFAAKTPHYVLSLLYLSLFGSVIAFGLYFTIARQRGYALASYISALTPPIAMLVSVIFEGARFGWSALIGLALLRLTDRHPLRNAP
jgi:hypothetical protein